MPAVIAEFLRDSGCEQDQTPEASPETFAHRTMVCFPFIAVRPTPMSLWDRREPTGTPLNHSSRGNQPGTMQVFRVPRHAASALAAPHRFRLYCHRRRRSSRRSRCRQTQTNLAVETARGGRLPAAATDRAAGLGHGSIDESSCVIADSDLAREIEFRARRSWPFCGGRNRVCGCGHRDRGY